MIEIEVIGVKRRRGPSEKGIPVIGSMQMQNANKNVST